MASPPRRRAQPRGGRGGAEPRARIRQREADVWSLSMQGYTQRDIAERVGVSQAAVSKTLRRLEQRHHDDLAQDQARVRARTQARLDFLYRQSIAGYDRSQADETRRRHRQSKVTGTARRQPPAAVMELTTVSRPGDPRFLQEAREALEASLRVSATLTPSAAASLPVTLDLSTLSDEELAVVERLRGRSTGSVARASRRRSAADTESPDEEDR